MTWHVTINGVVREITRDGDTLRVDGKVVQASVVRPPGSAVVELTIDGEVILLGLDGHSGSGWRLVHHGALHEVRVEDDRTLELRSRAPAPVVAGGAAVVRAPMPGLVVRVLVQEGEEVAQGSGVVVLEAMKMENELKAPRAGTVKALRVAPGQTVEKGTVLLEVGE